MSNSATPEGTSEPVAVAQPPADDQVASLRANMAQDPSDILSAIDLIKYYENKEDSESIRGVYEELHTRFPFYSPLWAIHLREDLQRDEFETVEKLLAQCLTGEIENNELSLWTTYLDYVRRKNNLITGGQEARAIVIQAFDLVLEKCGVFEPNSGQFWSDYLSFLEQWKPVNKWEEQQKVDMIRALYKRMLRVPFNTLEQMWGKYTQWEQDINSLTARKFIGELSGDYMKARSLYQEWSNVTKGLRRVAPISIRSVNKNNLPHGMEDDEAVAQIAIWKKWIEWEKENKLVQPEDTLNARINYVYKQSIIYMLFSPEIWYNYAMYHDDSNAAARQQILANGLKANPESISLTVKLSESFELENNTEMIKTTFDGTVKTIYSQYKRCLEEGSTERAAQLKEKLSYVYCTYMNTVKKVSGLSAARSIFGKCRKLKDNITHHVYIENAFLEYHNQADGYKTALKVLELGLKYFQADGEYINKYIDFLIMLNKDAQIKTLFESSIDKIDERAHARAMFKKVIAYETKYGNLANVYLLEKRFQKKYPKEASVELFSDRYAIQSENLMERLEFPYLEGSGSSSSSSGSKKRKRSRKHGDHSSSSSSKKARTGDKVEVPAPIVDMLKILPKRQYFKNAILNPASLVDFLVNQIEIPAESESAGDS